MYCSSCAKEVGANLTYCNHCGHRLSEARVDNSTSEINTGFLVSAMIGLFVFGLLAIGVLVSAMKRVDFDISFISAITIFSLVMMLMIEGLLAWMLLKGKKVEKQISIPNELSEQSVKEIYPAPARGLSEPTFQPIPTVTEHTTRSLDYVPKSDVDSK